MKYFSMFSGIGGFELGILRAQYAHLSKESEPQKRQQGWLRSIDEQGIPVLSGDYAPLCVGYSEIDKYAIKVYERHFKHDNYKDATTIDPERLPKFDLLVGGFPCQAFSIAGKRGGFADPRGTLFFDILRIAGNKRPRHLVLENVNGLLSHNNGETFKSIIGLLSHIGYRVEWQVLNSKNFGVPQNRERIFIVGHLRGECSGQILPITGTNGQITKIYGRVSGLNGHDYLKRVYSVDGSSPTLPTGTGGNHHAKIFDKPRVRRLTPIECERLQGFPDDWTAYGMDTDGMPVNISDSQRYKMCGNAVTVNVVQAVMEKLFEHTIKNVEHGIYIPLPSPEAKTAIQSIIEGEYGKGFEAGWEARDSAVDAGGAKPMSQKTKDRIKAIRQSGVGVDASPQRGKDNG